MKVFGLLLAIVIAVQSAPILKSLTIEERIAKARQGIVGLYTREEPWVAPPSFFEHNEDFEQQPHPRFWVAWSANTATNVIRFHLAVLTDGWIGWGPTASGGMIGGNPAVIREATPGNINSVRCYATHSDTFSTPLENEDQNCELISYERSSNYTEVIFERPLVGCKPDDQDFKQFETMRMIGAWGSTQSFYQHSIYDRFSFEINAVIGPIDYPPLPPNHIVFNVTLPARQLPAYRDVYECNGHEFPNDRRYHMIYSEAILYDLAPASYHHFLMFGCPRGLPNEYNDPNFVQDCPVIPHPSCIQFFNGWAIGQKSLYMDHGYPVGDDGRDGAALAFLFQSHIDNPSEQRITEPGWGATLIITATLTELESGAFGMYGGVPMGGMPEREESFTTRSECPSRMMSSVFPQTIYLHSVTPHAHALATGMKTQILRGRKWPRDSEWYEVGTDGDDNGPAFEQTLWDGNWQGFRFFLHPQRVDGVDGRGFEVQSGDRLRISCRYNTMNKTTPTRNGEGYEDEMCIHYIIYWPRGREVTICAEFPPEVLPPNERMSGIGVAFADAAPYFWAIPRDPETITELDAPRQVCSSKYNHREGAVRREL